MFVNLIIHLSQKFISMFEITYDEIIMYLICILILNLFEHILLNK